MLKCLEDYRPSAQAQAFHDCDFNYKFLVWGIKSGKTYAGAYEVLKTAYEKPGSFSWAVAPTYAHVEVCERQLLMMLDSDRDFLAKYNQYGFTSIQHTAYQPYIEMNVYPNPSNDRITIEIDDPHQGKAEVKVINLLGKIVYQEHLEQWETQMMLDLSYIVPGIYVVELELQAGIHLKKIIIQ